MRISLVIPCYNEQSNIQKGVLDKIGNFTANDDRFSEVIIVDDGSTDSSKKVIRQKYLKNFPKFKLIENSHQGKAFAVITGITKSQSEWVMFSDIDLATPLEEVEKLLARINHGAEIVIGSRSSARAGAPLMRKIMAKGLIIIRYIMIGLKGIKDTQCGFKLFKRDAAMDIISHLVVFHDRRRAEGPSVSAGFDLEFLFLAQRMGHKIAEVPVTWRHVETKNVNFIKDTIETLKDLYKIRVNDLRHKYQNS